MKKCIHKDKLHIEKNFIVSGWKKSFTKSISFSMCADCGEMSDLEEAVIKDKKEEVKEVNKKRFYKNQVIDSIKEIFEGRLHNSSLTASEIHSILYKKGIVIHQSSTFIYLKNLKSIGFLDVKKIGVVNKETGYFGRINHYSKFGVK